MKTSKRLLSLLAGSAVSIALPAALHAGSSAATATVTIDVSQPKKSVPWNYVGIFDSSNIGKGLYESSTNPHYDDYVSLIEQMKVRHWRVDGGSDTPALNDDFFSFVSTVNSFGGITNQPTVQWGLWLGNVDELSNNPTNAAHILQTSPDSTLIDGFDFGNETNFNQNLVKDQYLPAARDGATFNATKSFQGPDVTPPPNWVSGTTYHQHDVVTYTDGKVYVETLNSLLGNDPGTVAPPTNPHWTVETNPDPSSGGVIGRWNQQHGVIQNVVPGITPHFVGPDAGWGVPLTSVTPTGKSAETWTLAFAQAESANLKQVTQHLYTKDGGNGMLNSYYTYATTGSWPTGVDFVANDEVIYLGTLYRCNKHYTTTGSSGITPTNLNPSNEYWTPLEVPWAAGTVTQGQVVTYSGGTYQCILNGTSSVPPPSDTARWVTADRSQYAYPGPHQLCFYDTQPARVSEWLSAYQTGLAGASGWPSGMTYRMSEFSPFSGAGAGVYSGLSSDGQSLVNNYVTTIQANTNCFGSALVGFEMFQWWAAHGASGVDPTNSVWQINAPIVQTPYVLQSGQNVALANEASAGSGTYAAQPYAYAWLAFNATAFPGTGTALSVDGASPGIAVTSKSLSDLNFTAYAVQVGTNDVYVVLFNKTYAYDGVEQAQTVTATLNFLSGKGFTPKSYSMVTLQSGSTTGPACTAMTAEINTAKLTPGGSFTTPWPTKVAWTGSVTVQPFTALLIDVSNQNLP